MAVTSQQASHDSSPSVSGRSFLLAGLVVVAAALIAAILGIVYKHSFEFVCRDVFPAFACGSLSLAFPRAIIVGGLLTLFLIVDASFRRGLIDSLRAVPSIPWLGTAVVGAALILAPWLYLHIFSAQVAPLPMMGSWLIGLALFTLGTLFAIARWQDLAPVLREHTWGLVLIVTFGLVLPEIALGAQNSWKLWIITDASFWSLEFVLTLLGEEVYTEPGKKIIGIGEFIVAVGPQCSGIEGLGLISAFTAVFLYLFRDRIIPGRAIWLLPIGLLLSWCLNVVRMATLMMIGRYVSPELAIEGFHSHAGWLLFLSLALALSIAATRVKWFLRDEPAAAAMLTAEGSVSGASGDQNVQATEAKREDATGLVLPFVLFMLISAILPAVSQTPATLYPVKLLVMVIGLWICREAWLRLELKADPLAIGTGALIGVLWLVTAPSTEGVSPLQAWLEAAPAALVFIWVVSRLIGTVVAVPIIEELFFRGYVQSKIDTGGLTRKLIAIAVSSLLFGVLHGRILEAALAGVVFGLLYMRSGRLGDAIISHAVANAVIAAYALYVSDWSLI